MKRAAENIAASIQVKLKNRAGETGRSFNETLQYYGMERFLYRLRELQSGAQTRGKRWSRYTGWR